MAIYYSFWYGVEKLLKPEHVTEYDIRCAIQQIREPFKSGFFRDFSEIDFNDEVNVCAYLRYFAAAHFSLSCLAVLRFFDHVPNFKHELSMKPELRVVSVGGGPGMDLFAFCTALCDPTKPNFFTGELETFIFDRYHWQEAALVAHKLMIDTTKPWARSFKLDTLDQPICLEVDFRDREQLQRQRQLLSTSDVILVVKVLTVLDPWTARFLLEEIFDAMSNGNIVIIDDTGLDRYNYPKVDFRVLYQEHTQVYNNSTDNESVPKSTYEVRVLQKYVVDNDDYEDDSSTDENDDY